MRPRLEARARLLAAIRRFFAARGVLEVQTPILSAAGTTDPNIESFRTEFHGPEAAGAPRRWLRTSPEFFHKRLLAAGSGPIYELGQVFRDGEFGRHHNPEFTLLEWYRPGFDLDALMDEVRALVEDLARSFDRRPPYWRRMSYAELYAEYAGIDVWQASDAELRDRLGRHAPLGDGLERDDWLDLIRTLLIEPRLDPDLAVLLDRFPASQAALARIDPGPPATAARFELYLGRLEIANGYHELTSAAEQRGRFRADAARRRRRGQVDVPADGRFLAALEQGLPDCCGVAVGVDRLLLWLIGAERLADVLEFPFDQA